ncbi:MAG: hypothetical protein HC828_18685 [Blastochloris sp.]|nr:hypothetical protein [Blastochloris sp.]
MKLCIPGQESTCNRAGVAEAPTPITGTGPAATPDTGGGTVPTDATVGNTPVPTATPQPAGLGALRTEMVDGPVDGFAHASFAQIWERSDKPIAEKRAERSWVWGAEGPDGAR